jgi:hypothetical protein
MNSDESDYFHAFLMKRHQCFMCSKKVPDFTRTALKKPKFHAVHVLVTSFHKYILNDNFHSTVLTKLFTS